MRAGSAIARVLVATVAVCAGGAPASAQSESESESAEQPSTALLERAYGGRVCSRIPHENPDGKLESSATKEAVHQTCGSLGCVAVGEGPIGRCGRPVGEADCAGVAPDVRNQRCPPAPDVALPSSNRLRPRRFLLTATAFVTSDLDGYGGVHPSVFPGLFLQIALTRARALQAPGGGFVWEGIGRWYLHGGVFGGRGLVGHDVGLVWRLPPGTFTRGGLTAYGQYLDQPTPSARHAYRVGPAVHLEVAHNLLFRVSWLPAGSAIGPRWTVGVEYTSGLIDDLRLSEAEALPAVAGETATGHE